MSLDGVHWRAFLKSIRSTQSRMSASSRRTIGDSNLRAKHRRAEEQQKHRVEIAALEERISQTYGRMANAHEEESKP